MKLSIVIVNYNVKYFLELALQSVFNALEGIDAEVWVVDNDSSDDSIAMLNEKFPQVKVIENKKNVGFSVANNQAIALSKGEYILLLNPDTVVEETTFNKIISFMDAHPLAGGLGVKMIDGAGNFLPESKRGFPSPRVAFCKTFGLSSIFSKSKYFNYYHLGHLPADEINEVDILAGAFMLLRKTVLDKIGLLDEAFFMYGEDIDLSYRIVQAGYKNYYYPQTHIIHFKGESTKKGSLNYVKTFYQAMIIFAKKHFKGNGALAFVMMLQFAIYFRAFITLMSNLFKRSLIPIIDILVMFIGMIWIKEMWAAGYYKDSAYFKKSLLWVNIPLYAFIWVASIFFNGGYDSDNSLRRLIRGVLFGTLIIAAVYGFLPMEYRFSRVFIVLSMTWVLIMLTSIRFLRHFFIYKNFNIGSDVKLNLLIVGSEHEEKRALNLLRVASVSKNYLGRIDPQGNHHDDKCLGDIERLDEVVKIFKIKEIIFCSADLSAAAIMNWMLRLGNDILYKIIPENSDSIIGSSSKNSSGELYTIDVQFNISTTTQKRNKRFFDIAMTLLALLMLPILIFFNKNIFQFLLNCYNVFLGKKTWVAYSSQADEIAQLPKLKKSVLNTSDGLNVSVITQSDRRRLDFLYARDYKIEDDALIMLRNIRHLDKK
ncbi:MAG: glycosyltransferase [Saprospiraceae bacterium]|nr:glycosyltransferase [Saprospiraceae bacterium]